MEIPAARARGRGRAHHKLQEDPRQRVFESTAQGMADGSKGEFRCQTEENGPGWFRCQG